MNTDPKAARPTGPSRAQELSGRTESERKTELKTRVRQLNNTRTEIKGILTTIKYGKT